MIVGHQDAGDAVLVHELQGIAHSVVRLQRVGVLDVAALGALDLAHLLRLGVHRHEPVDDTHAASRAMAMAMSASVTVSMLAETMGVAISMVPEKREHVP